MASRDTLPFEAYKRNPSQAHLADLLKYYQDHIYNICFQVLGHPEDAEDVAQEVLLQVTRCISTIDSQRQFKVWLYRVALNSSLNLRKSRVRRIELAKSLDLAIQRGVDTMLGEERAALLEAMGELDDRDRCLLLEHYFDKLTLEEIGEREGISSVAVWKRLERAREMVRRALLGAGFTITGAGIAQGLESVTPVIAPAGLLGTALVAKAAATATGGTIVTGGSIMGGAGVITVGTAAALIFVLGARAYQPATLTSTADFQRGNNEGLISTAQDRLTRDRITAGTAGAWTSTTALPAARDTHSSTVYNGFLYVIGGFGPGTISRQALVAPINANGSVGSWFASTLLPTARWSSASVAYSGFIYVMGGFNGNDGTLSDVLVAPLAADGSIGAWASTTALPSARQWHSTVAYNGFIYAIGGSPNGISNNILFAPLNADGSVGTWAPTTALSNGRSTHSAVAYNGFLYVMGGSDTNFNIASDVFVAPMNADGTVGAWSTTSALPSGRIIHSSFAHNGFLYVIGGTDDVTFFSDVLVATLNANGSVGSWTSTTALPSGRYAHTAVAYNGFAYTIGGSNGNNSLSDVLVAPLDADAVNANQQPERLRGVFSHVVDLQSDASTISIVLNGQTSPGGRVRLQARVAPAATGIFGTETVVDPAPLGSTIQVPATGRYVWIRLTLDDTATTNAAQPTYVSDITIGAPPSTGVVSDGLGADIDTQTSTATIEANWGGFTASAGDSIASYEWAIGTAPGLTNVQDWVSVGAATNASNSSLSLNSGMKFVSVRATSALGLTSPAAFSDGVQVLPPPSAPGSGEDTKKGRCGLGASTASGSLAVLLGGMALLGVALRRRRALRG